MTIFQEVAINYLEEGNWAYELTQPRLSVCSTPLEVLELSSPSGQVNLFPHPSMFNKDATTSGEARAPEPQSPWHKTFIFPPHKGYVACLSPLPGRTIIFTCNLPPCRAQSLIFAQ